MVQLDSDSLLFTSAAFWWINGQASGTQDEIQETWTQFAAVL